MSKNGKSEKKNLRPSTFQLINILNWGNIQPAPLNPVFIQAGFDFWTVGNIERRHFKEGELPVYANRAFDAFVIDGAQCIKFDIINHVSDEKENELELMKLSSADMNKFGNSAITVKLDLVTWMVLIGTAQIGLRHPNNIGANANVCRNCCDFVINQIEKISPNIAGLLRLGFKPKFNKAQE